MPESAPISVARLLSLVAWIGDHPGVGVDELAEHFHRTPRQIRRDIESLGRVGDSLPGRSFEIDWDLYETQRRLTIRTTLGADLPPRLTPAEATAILVGLLAVSDGLDDELRSRIPRIALAVRALSPQVDPEAFTASAAAGRDDKLDLLTEALSVGRRVRFDYTSRDGRSSRRLVDPWQVRLGAAGWLLRGWCWTADEGRTFRVDRMSGLEIDDAKIRRREILPEGDSRTLPLTIAPGAQWIVDDLGARVVRVHEDGALDVELPVWDEVYVDALLTDIAAFLVDAPAERMKRLARRSTRALGVWERVDSSEEMR